MEAACTARNEYPSVPAAESTRNFASFWYVTRFSVICTMNREDCEGISRERERERERLNGFFFFLYQDLNNCVIYRLWCFISVFISGFIGIFINKVK